MIVINLDVELAKKKMRSGDLAERVGITPANLSILKTGKAKAIRFSTLEAICKELGCQPGDILEYVPDQKVVQRMLIRFFILIEYELEKGHISCFLFLCSER